MGRRRNYEPDHESTSEGDTEVTPRQEFKQCLIKGWLTHSVWQCAIMIMVDHKLPYKYSGHSPDMGVIRNFLRDIGVPPYAHMMVSVYIAAFYPMTSAALFMNQVNILRIFWREKAQLPDINLSLAYSREEENLKDRQVRYIFLRNLSKWRDWKTVK
jgi:hypothetical protein